jgi:hypothetical protein
MDTSIQNFKNIKSFYHMNCDFDLLVELFGNWFTYNTLIQYKDKYFILDIETYLDHDNMLYVYAFIDSKYINQEIKFKNTGSELIYLLDELVETNIASRK